MSFTNNHLIYLTRKGQHILLGVLPFLNSCYLSFFMLDYSDIRFAMLPQKDIRQFDLLYKFFYSAQVIGFALLIFGGFKLGILLI